MSIIFKTLQKLNNQSAENIQNPVSLKENMRPSPLADKQIRKAAAGLSLLLLGAAALFMFYPTSNPVTPNLCKDNTSASYSVANASIAPASLEGSIQAIFLSDENMRKFRESSDPYIFLPPEVRGELKESPVFYPKEIRRKKIISSKGKISAKPGFKPTKKKRRPIVGSVITEQQIVRKIEMCIIEGETQKAEELLKQLAVIKGEDSIYVMKLKAFFFLRTGETRPAVALLRKVLATNADDVEAGINMAILEIKLKEYSKAKERLTRLKGLYPENRVIPNLLSKLN